MLDDNSNGNNSMLHTDGTTPDNSIVLFYGDVPADGMKIWIRTDVVPPVSDRDFMYNVDVEVLGVNNDVIWKNALNSTLYSPT